MFSSEQTPDKNNLTKFIKEIFALASSPKFDVGKTRKLITQIANSPIVSFDDKLAKFLAFDLLWQIPDLNVNIVKDILSMRTPEQLDKDPFLADLHSADISLSQTIDKFCQQTKLQLSYCQIELDLNNPQTENILKFICQQTAARYKMENPSWIFEPYSHPEKNNVPGVWMSKSGEHFTNQALLKLERAKNAAFEKLYLIPAAQSAVGKEIPIQ